MLWLGIMRGRGLFLLVPIPTLWSKSCKTWDKTRSYKHFLELRCTVSWHFQKCQEKFCSNYTLGAGGGSRILPQPFKAVPAGIHWGGGGGPCRKNMKGVWKGCHDEVVLWQLFSCPFSDFTFHRPPEICPWTPVWEPLLLRPIANQRLVNLPFGFCAKAWLLRKQAASFCRPKLKLGHFLAEWHTPCIQRGWEL